MLGAHGIVNEARRPACLRRRESAEPSRIRDRHRRLLILNHPDTGGSGYIAAKINEAKDVFVKGVQTKR